MNGQHAMPRQTGVWQRGVWRRRAIRGPGLRINLVLGLLVCMAAAGVGYMVYLNTMQG